MKAPAERPAQPGNVRSQHSKSGYMIFPQEGNNTCKYYPTRCYILNYCFSIKIGLGRIAIS